MARITLRLGALAAALMLLPTTALGAAGFDVWQGHKGKVTVQYQRASGSDKLIGSISIECKLGGVTNSYGAQDLKGTAHGKKVTLKGSAFNTSGSSTVKASLKKHGAKASLKASYDYGDEDASTNCKVDVKKIKMKYYFTTGG